MSEGRVCCSPGARGQLSLTYPVLEIFLVVVLLSFLYLTVTVFTLPGCGGGSFAIRSSLLHIQGSYSN